MTTLYMLDTHFSTCQSCLNSQCFRPITSMKITVVQKSISPPPFWSLCKVALVITKFQLTPKLGLSVFRMDTVEKWHWYLFTALVVFIFVLPVDLVCPSLLMHVRKWTAPHFTIRTANWMIWGYSEVKEDDLSGICVHWECTRYYDFTRQPRAVLGTTRGCQVMKTQIHRAFRFSLQLPLWTFVSLIST